METITLSVPEIHCGHCKESIEGAVGALDGVAKAVVDVDAKTVEVTYDRPADLDSVRAVIVGVGFDVP